MKCYMKYLGILLGTLFASLICSEEEFQLPREPFARPLRYARHHIRSTHKPSRNRALREPNTTSDSCATAEPRLAWYPKRSNTAQSTDSLEFGQLTTQKIAAQEARDRAFLALVQALKERDHAKLAKYHTLLKLDDAYSSIMRLEDISNQAIIISEALLAQNNHFKEENERLSTNLQTLQEALNKVTHEKDAALKNVTALALENKKVRDRQNCHTMAMVCTALAHNQMKQAGCPPAHSATVPRAISFPPIATSASKTTSTLPNKPGSIQVLPAITQAGRQPAVPPRGKTNRKQTKTHKHLEPTKK